MFRLDPLTVRKLKRFRSIRRGYFSFLGLIVLVVMALAAELWVNDKALVVSHGGKIYFPVFGDPLMGRDIGLTGFEAGSEVKYRKFAAEQEGAGGSGWVIMPFVPYNPFEVNMEEGGGSASRPPSLSEKHYLGTDTYGRDVLARIIYGFRIAIFFSISIMIAEWFIGIAIGCMMGYRGGWFDSIMQRVVEIFQSIPTLYVIMILSSIVVPSIHALGVILVIFGWMGMANTIRAMTYKEKASDYVLAVRGLGASHLRILAIHIVPNTVAILVTSFPFALLSGVNALTSLDYLGFGLPAPTPSWGELLKQGTSNLQYPWIVWSVTSAIIIVLTMATFFGEAVREAADPKQHTVYE